MSGHTDGDDDRPGDHSRRAVLAGAATALSATGTLTSQAAGKQITVPAVIPKIERWPDANLAGFMIHVGPTTDPAELTATETCEFADWPPDTTIAYDASIINRKLADTPEENTILYVSEDASIPAGALFLVNTFNRCDGPFVGVNVGQIGRYDVAGPGVATDYGPVAEVEEDERPNTQTNDSGGSAVSAPGFGVGAALVGVLGGALLRLRREGVLLPRREE